MPAQDGAEGGEKGLSLKVIHGQGSSGGDSWIKPRVMAALQKHVERLSSVMEQDVENPSHCAVM